MFSTPIDFHREMNRFRHQMNHMFNDFDHSFAMHHDPFFGMVWNDPVPYGVLAEQNRPEQKESGEQKSSATGSGTGDAATSSTQMAVEATNPTTSTTSTPNANTTGTVSQSQSLATQPQHPGQWPWRWLSTSTGGAGSMVPSFNSISTPRVDLLEKDDHFLLNCDLPGIAKEDVKVAVSPNGVLSINAEHSEKHEEKDDKTKYHRVERSYGKYSRSMQLPENVDSEAVKAKHENGLLQLTLPKKLKAEPKAIKNVPIL